VSQAMSPDPEDLSADALVERVRTGELAYFEQIIRRYQADVHKIVLAMMADRSATEDLAQQVFVNVYHALDQYDLGRGLGRWIRAIARNAVLEELRRRGRYRGRVGEYARWVEQRVSEADSAQRGLHDRIAYLRECIERLDAGHAEAVRRRYLHQQGLSEIAEAIGRSTAAVRNLLSRVRVKLRECVEQKEAAA